MDSPSEGMPGPSQSVRHPGAPSLLAWGGAWAGMVALAVWIAQLVPGWLALAALGALVWSASAGKHGARWPVAAAAALWLAIGAALGVQARLGEIARSWEPLRTELETRSATALNSSLDRLVDEGEEAVTGAGAIVRGASRVSGAMFLRLDERRRASGMSALAVFDPGGRPLLWSGEHRGSIPVQALRGLQPYVFSRGPLFSYLYFSRPVGDGRTAVAAVLLEGDLSAGSATPSFAAAFARSTGLTPRFSLPDQAACGSIWDWATDRPILSVCFETLTQANWWAHVAERARAGVAAAWLLALVMVAIGWYRYRMPAPGVPVAMATVGFVVLPLGEVLEVEALFSPVQFVLPLPWDVTLGTFLVILLGLAVWVLVRTADQDPGRLSLPWWAQAALGGGAVASVYELVRRSAAVGLLAGAGGGGLALQLATTLAIAIPLYLVLWVGRGRAAPGGRGGLLIAAGFALAALGGLAVATLGEPIREIPPALGAAWAVPFALVALGLSRLPPRATAFRPWLVAGCFAAMVALPTLWHLHARAKLQTAEIELARLGTEADPFLDFLLRTFAENARHFADEGEGGVNLLYRSWVASGLARQGYEARLTTWEGGVVGDELRLAESPEMPAAVPHAVAEARGADREVVARYTEVEGLHYLLVVPLPGDRMISVAVPPRSRLTRATALARFLESDAEAGSSGVVESLYLVPLTDPAEEAAMSARGARAREVAWLRTESGWRSEAHAHFPAGWMHVHLFVRTSTTALMVVRAVLLTAFLAGLLVVLWVTARFICVGPPVVPSLAPRWVRSFRGRLTLALFVFFLVPTASFAAIAYQAVAREVAQSAARVALRALDQTVTNISTTPLTRAGEEVGVDLLHYRDGALAGASAPEAIALGLFDSWLPPAIYLALASGEELEDLQIRTLGENRYLVGYRRFDAGDVYAAPIPLEAEEIRRRETEFRDLALLMLLLGAGLSVYLSLLVGRAFARPIDELSRAASAIGSGNLRVHLPEERVDEFGPVYRSFNRMARRLRRARSALERETRRTETIVGEAATGVLALDAEGRVELVNPRAEEILGESLQRGAPLPRSNALLSAVAEAVGDFRVRREDEAGRELEVEGRIVRLRLRRLTSGGERPGAVVALEDVTDEIRTARVLAWGEMARQVAHEIKNPLTPIKLAVQHLRRAYYDGRKEFGDILDRNADAILHEIDRLSEIARAFSRFGTPGAQTELESVDVARAVHDTLAIYRGTGSGVAYEAAIDSAEGVRAIARLGELKEVLVNLLENAREALNGSGRITVEVVPHGDWVDVTVADTGEGIPAELLPRIFDPHFSTRTSGTGLGLAIVRRLAESWGGEATAESEPGVGTRVTIRLRAGEGG